jgi:hypothetical protein
MSEVKTRTASLLKMKARTAMMKVLKWILLSITLVLKDWFPAIVLATHFVIRKNFICFTNVMEFLFCLFLFRFWYLIWVIPKSQISA